MALGDLSTTISQAGNAVSALFGGKGFTAEANSYQGAAALANQNAQLTNASTRIQGIQVARQVYQSIGATRADVAGAGFTQSGSALDLLSSSAQQGALAKALVNIQGAINENAYAAQAGAFAGQASSAKSASSAANIGGIMNAGASAIGAVGGLLNMAGVTVAGAKSAASSLYDSIFGSGQIDYSSFDAVGPYISGGIVYPSADAVGPFLSGTDQAIANGANVPSISSLGLPDFNFADIGSSISDFFSSLF